MLQDRIFVNKVVFGPELLPGLFKVPGLESPERNQIIIFENPSYIGRGPLFDIVQRVIYMLTLSLVDIDRDEFGQPRAHFLIKRAVGAAGDTIRTMNGNLLIRPAGDPGWHTEPEFQTLNGFFYPVQRLMDEADYRVIETAGLAIAKQDLGLPLSSEDIAAQSALSRIGASDPFALDAVRSKLVYSAIPDNAQIRERVQFNRTGWYVPAGRILPLGDNRDNSRDGRYFGAVRIRHVLGRAMFIYWPFSRAGAIR
jgi:signal peptidase I